MTLTGLVENLSGGYKVPQAGVITAAFMLGALFLQAFGGSVRRERIMGLLLAFPAGFSLFAVSAYLMLCLGIPYGTISVSVVLILLGIISAGVIIRHIKKVDIKSIGKELSCAFCCFIAIFAIAFMLTNNLFHVSLDNDSLYYFSTYPEAIVAEGRYIKQFDVFLTDASPIGSIVHTLPYIYGFSETFGIQYFVDLNFLLLFAYGIYKELSGVLAEREALLCSAVSVFFLMTSSAYLTTAKWIMAGVYFMSFYFICAYLGYFTSGILREGRPYVLLALFAVMTAMMRHEGVAMVLILVLTLSALSGYSGRELTLGFILPVMIAAGLYYTRVFLILKVFPLYAFLTPVKAGLFILALAASGLYLLFIRDRLSDGWKRRVLLILPGLLLGANIGLLILRGRRYLGNLKMFYLNVRIGAGWGYFGYIAPVIMLVLIVKGVLRKEKRLLFFESLMFSYVLMVFLVSFGRGDSLRKGVGDSGNRVMLTAVPLIVFAIVLRVFYSDRKEGVREE